MMRRHFSLLLLAGILGSTAAQAQSAPSTGGLKVRVHIFSGRPDPEFRITDPEVIARIRAILAANSAEDTQAPSSEVLTHGLGYRGIEIFPEPGSGMGDVSVLAVNHTRIQVRHGAARGASRARLHRDAASELEGYLLNRGVAQGHLTPQMLQRIRQR